MGSRINYRLAKSHRNYSVEEVATLFGVHRNTVREWTRRGLPVIAGRPVLILGRDLVGFLKERRARNRRPCGPGEIYCVRCRQARRPAGGMVDWRPMTSTLGSLVGICPCCDALMFRRANLRRLALVLGPLEITLPEGLPHIGERAEPTVNSDLEA